MTHPLLDRRIQQYIDRNIGADIAKLALSKNPFEVNWQELLEQIAAKTKAKDKLPTWFAKQDILYPAKVSIEQTSSEITAKYKSEIISGISLIDLTGGFGVDDYFFSKRFGHVVHCELDAELSAKARHNFAVLGAENIECITGDGSEILKRLNRQFDWIYIDPSRRNSAKGKVFMLADCSPNVPELFEFYLTYTNNLLIKTAPLLDITSGLNELRNVCEIHVVAVENEVKELLWIIKKGFSGKPLIKSVNFTRDKVDTFIVSDNGNVQFGMPQSYLYEPNSAIMKAGAFNEVATTFNLFKLHKHSHLYTSEKLLLEFPGRIFELFNQFPYNKQTMKKILEGKKANIATRNFPESVEFIRKKWKIRDGGHEYCFFTTDLNDAKIVLICTKI